jgi:NADH-quinone oxidoreductase subunit H
MALGWKVLIPVSLVWIMIVAITHSLRTHGYDAAATGLITVGIVVALILLLVLWRAWRASSIRRIPQTAPDESAFPVPPLPSPRTSATKERTDA